jgi:hypothetical protein
MNIEIERSEPPLILEDFLRGKYSCVFLFFNHVTNETVCPEEETVLESSLAKQ